MGKVGVGGGVGIEVQFLDFLFWGDAVGSIRTK